LGGAVGRSVHAQSDAIGALPFVRRASFVLACGVMACTLSACGAGGAGGDDDDDDDDDSQFTGNSNPTGGAGGAGAGNPPNGAAGTGGTQQGGGAAPNGAGGTTGAGANGGTAGEGTGNVGGLAPNNGTGGTNNGAGGNGQGGSAQAGAAGSQNNGGGNGVFVGRAGVELCPPGPFGAPLPANPQVDKLFSVGENNFFLFEGPVWANGTLYFSEIGGGSPPPPSRVNRIGADGSLERVFEDTGSNGLAIDDDGNLVAATHDVGAISAFSLPGGARSAVGAQTFNGQRFNSPNDLVVRSDGNIYFTDPAFQAPGNPQGTLRVYRLSPSGEASVVDASLSNPNGITMSPDGNTLYVTAAGRFVRYALAADGTPSAGTEITVDGGLQTPDGMAMDCAGNVYTTEHFLRQIRIFDPSGNQIDLFELPPVVDRDITNLAFGGPNRTTLFITTTTQGQEGGLFSVELQVPGLPY
jgi:gluconolactonase